MNKKGLEASQIFVYVVSIVVVGLVLLFGTRAIMSMQSDMCQVNYIQFKTELHNTIDDVLSDYGSVKQIELKMPCSYKKLCFADLNAPTVPQSVQQDQPLIADAWSDKTANVFLLETSIKESFKEGKLQVDAPDGYLCLEREGGMVRMRLEGLGRNVKVGRWNR